MTDVEPEVVEPVAEEPKFVTTRIVMVDNCGPSPLGCLYTKRLTYEVHEEDVMWVLENQYGYIEGETPCLPLAERLKVRQELEAAAEHAARLEHAEQLRAARAAREAEIAAQGASDTMSAREKLLASREARRLAEAEAQAKAAAEQDEARLRLLKSRRLRAAAEEG